MQNNLVVVCDIKIQKYSTVVQDVICNELFFNTLKEKTESVKTVLVTDTIAHKYPNVKNVKHVGDFADALCFLSPIEQNWYRFDALACALEETKEDDALIVVSDLVGEWIKPLDDFFCQLVHKHAGFLEKNNEEFYVHKTELNNRNDLKLFCEKNNTNLHTAPKWYSSQIIVGRRKKLAELLEVIKRYTKSSVKAYNEKKPHLASADAVLSCAVADLGWGNCAINEAVPECWDMADYHEAKNSLNAILLNLNGLKRNIAPKVVRNVPNDMHLMLCADVHQHENLNVNKRYAFALETWKRFTTKKVNHCFINSSNYYKTSANIGDSRKILYIKDLVEEGFKKSEKLSNKEPVVVIVNSDIAIVQSAEQRILEKLTYVDAIYANRKNVNKYNKYLSENELRQITDEQRVGVDLFAFRRSWWDKIKDTYPDMLFGCELWDLILKDILFTYGPGQEGLVDNIIWHERHVAQWTVPAFRFSNAGQIHNRSLGWEYAKKKEKLIPELQGIKKWKTATPLLEEISTQPENTTATLNKTQSDKESPEGTKNMSISERILKMKLTNLATYLRNTQQADMDYVI